MALTIETSQAMVDLGQTIGGRLGPGDLVLLDGALGAGKTTLARGIGAALGVRGAITSPTFVLARTHPRSSESERELDAAAPAPLVHVDAYRLSTAADLADLDIDYSASIVVVEWARHLLDGVSEAWLAVQLERRRGGLAAADSRGRAVGGRADDEDEPRFVTVTGHGARWRNLDWLNAARD